MTAPSSALMTPRCRICYDCSYDSTQGRLIRPCNCTGSVALVHTGCLNRWLESKADTRCELCYGQFEVVACGLKGFWELSLPHPLDTDMESRFEFAFLGLWLLDTLSLLSKTFSHGSRAFSVHMGSKFGQGWLLYAGSVCTVVNIVYYGSIFLLVLDQWLCENTVLELKDRNSQKQRQKIAERIKLMKTGTFVTCRQEQPSVDGLQTNKRLHK